MSVAKVCAGVLAAAFTVGMCAAAPSARATAADPTGKYQVVAPARIVDTRAGIGLPRNPIGAGASATFQVTGRGGVPATGVQSVVLNITVVNPDATGWLVAYASGSTQPPTSTVNYPRGATLATGETVPVGADGRVRLTLGNASTDVVVDVMGWYATSASTVAPGSLYLASAPSRLFDSRTGTGRIVAPGAFVDVPIDFDETGGRRLNAMQFNLTSVGGAAPGWFTAWSGTGTPPSTSALNFARGETAPNQVTVPVRRGAAVPEAPGHVYYYARIANTSTNPAAASHLVVDAVGGFFTDPANFGTTHVVVPATRVGDSRTGVGLPKAKVGAGATVALTVPAALANSRTDALEGTITMANLTTNSYLTLFAAGEERPSTSAVNTVTRVPRSNGFATYPSNARAFSIFNSTGSTDVILDVTGRFELTDEAIGAVG